MSNENPYEGIDNFSKATAVLIATLVPTFLGELSKELPIAMPMALSFALALLVSALLYAFCETVVLRFVLGLDWFRYLLLQEKYFEGYWIEKVTTPTGEHAISIVYFSKSQKTFTMHGQTFDKEFNSDTVFSADFFDLRWPTLGSVPN